MIRLLLRVQLQLFSYPSVLTDFKNATFGKQLQFMSRKKKGRSIILIVC